MTAEAALDNSDFWLPAYLLNEETAQVSKVKDSYEPEMPMLEVCSEEEDEDEFFAKLSQRLSMSVSRNVPPMDLCTSLKVSSGSPESTLGRHGRWSGGSSNRSNSVSPPETPFRYQPTGQVDGLQRNIKDAFTVSTEGQWRAVAKPNLKQNEDMNIHAVQEMKARYLAAVMQANKAALALKQRLHDMRRAETLGNTINGVGSEAFHRSAWPPLQQANAPVKSNFRALPLLKNESGGTGVFIPRRFDASTNVPPRKRAVVPCALVPTKVVHALNTSMQSMNNFPRPHSSPIPSGEAISQQSFDALMARRRALLDQQQGSMMGKTEDIITRRSLEACLPQEWSY